MRNLWKYGFVLFCYGLVLAGPMPSFAAGVHFWVGLGTNQTQAGHQWVPVLVGTDETSNPKTFTVAMSVLASGPNNFQCTITTEVSSKFHPAVTMPVQFQVAYPAILMKKQLPPVQYTVKAVIHSIQGGTVAPTTQYQNQVTRAFPGGGTPQCARTSCPAGANCSPPSN